MGSCGFTSLYQKSISHSLVVVAVSVLFFIGCVGFVSIVFSVVSLGVSSGIHGYIILAMVVSGVYIIALCVVSGVYIPLLVFACFCMGFSVSWYIFSVFIIWLFISIVL